MDKRLIDDTHSHEINEILIDSDVSSLNFFTLRKNYDLLKSITGLNICSSFGSRTCG